MRYDIKYLDHDDDDNVHETGIHFYTFYFKTGTSRTKTAKTT